MAVVHFVRKVPAVDGSLVAAKGSLRFTPTARRVIVGTPDVTVLPASFTAQLVNGAVDVTLAPTTGAWAWRIDESITGLAGRTTYVAVPDVAEKDDPDLVEVDIATLEPAAIAEPGWVAMANSTVSGGTVAGDDLILTRTDGTTVNAGNVRGPAGTPGTPGAPGAPGTTPPLRVTVQPYKDTIDAPLSTDAPTVTRFVASDWAQMTEAGWNYVHYKDLATPGLLATEVTDVAIPPGTYGNQTITTIGPIDMPFAVEWVQDGTSAGLVVINKSTGAAKPNYRIFVDGKPVTAAVQEFTEATSLCFIKMVWATAAVRRIHVELSYFAVVRVDKPKTSAVYAPASRRPRIAVLGDSWVEGMLETGHPRLDAMVWVLGKLTGADVYVAGYGATGYHSGKGYTPDRHYGSTERLARIYLTNPDYVVIFGSINDNAWTAELPAAAANLYAAIATNLPKAKIIVVGPQSYNDASNTGSQNIANRDAVKAAALAAPNVLGFIDPMAEKWVTGTGNSTTPTGDGTADRFHNGANLNHLTKAGNRYYGERLAAEIAALTI